MKREFDLTDDQYKKVKEYVAKLVKEQPIKYCRYCGKQMKISRTNPTRQVTCGSKSCRKAHLIERHGGIEGYREWERTRRKKWVPGERSPGRPKKKGA